MRKTNQKEAIFLAVQTLKNHPSADQIYYELKGQNTKLSLGTVYRNLNKFARDGKICKIILPNGCDRFDYRLEKHEHFICKKCSAVFDADVTVSLDVKKCSFTVDDYALLLYGTCTDCRKQA